MKNTAYIFLFVLLFGISIYGQDCLSNVMIKTNDSKSVIYVDNKVVGNGEVTVGLSIGQHFLKVKNQELKWDAEIIRDTINVSECNKDLSFSYSFIHKYYLDSEPQDAFVYKNDKLVGYTPLFVHNGINSISLTKKDYSNQLVNLKELPASNKVVLDFTGMEKETHFTDTYWFEVLIGTAVALGATAAHFKIEADKQYDKYLETNDNKYLDETNKNDLYSGIAFGVLQVNFGYLIYKLLSE